MGDAFRQASSNSEEAGRKSKNDALGIGRKWDTIIAKRKNMLTMSKVQINAAVQEFGRIEATNAEILKHAKSGGSDAIDGARYGNGAQSKGVERCGCSDFKS
ncbi:MAG: hypothetical protein COA39_011060 [Sulfurimonas sp.]|nr:hypothetical protein [Sulfurimonas sp.]